MIVVKIMFKTLEMLGYFSVLQVMTIRQKIHDGGLRWSPNRNLKLMDSSRSPDMHIGSSDVKDIPVQGLIDGADEQLHLPTEHGEDLDHLLVSCFRTLDCNL